MATISEAPPPPGVRTPAAVGPIRLAIVWWLGCGAVALRLTGHGPAGVRAAVLVALLGVVGLAALRLDLLTARDRVVALIAIGTVGYLLTAGTVGRMPVPVALASLVLADAAMFGPRTALARRADPPISLALLVLAASSAAWLALGSNAIVAVALAAAGATIALHLAGVTAGVDRALAAPFARWGERQRARRAVTVALDRANRPYVWAFLFCAVATAPIFHRAAANPGLLIRGTSDIPGTLERVRWMELFPPRIPVPHPGWSFAVKLTSPVLGELVAATAILAVATGASAVVLMTIARGRWDDLPPLRWPLAVGYGVGYVVMENPAVFAPRSDGWWSRYVEAGTHARGQGYLPLHQWGTPTITMSMPFVFAMVALLLLVIAEAERSDPRLHRHQRILAVLTVVTTLVQPATTLAVVPGVVVYLVLSGRLSAATARAAGPWFVVPGALICLGQTAFLITDVSPWEQAHWIWRPGWAWSYFGLDRPAFWSTMAVGAVALWAGGRRFLRDPAVGLSATALAVGLVPFLLWEMVGIYDVPDGDLGVPALMSSILFVLASLRFLLLELQAVWERWQAERTPAPAWAVPAVLLLAVMVAAGTYDLLSSGGFTQEI